MDRNPEGARIFVLIPALNEEEALPLVLAELPVDRLSGVLVVDNGSTDRTAEVARAGGAEVVREDRRGYGRACLSGLAALGVSLADSEPPLAHSELALVAPEAQDVIVFLDADHSDYPEDLMDVAGPVLRSEADFVIGSRVLGGASRQALLPQAWFGNKLACTLMRLLFGARYSDLGPFRALRVEALEQLAMSDPDFGWTIEMQLKAHSAKLRVVEVPVRYRPRIGTSKITGTIRGSVSAGLKILMWIFRWRWKLWREPLEVTTSRSPSDPKS